MLETHFWFILLTFGPIKVVSGWLYWFSDANTSFMVLQLIHWLKFSSNLHLIGFRVLILCQKTGYLFYPFSDPTILILDIESWWPPTIDIWPIKILEIDCAIVQKEARQTWITGSVNHGIDEVARKFFDFRLLKDANKVCRKTF